MNDGGMAIRRARLYDLAVRALLGRYEDTLRRRSVALAELRPQDVVLDVGCGTGALALAARASVTTGSVTGLDLSPAMIAQAQAKAARRGLALDFKVGSIAALPYADGSVDVVLSSLMMHHLPDSVKAAGLREVARVLRPGGRCVIVDIREPRTWPERLLQALSLHGRTQGLEPLPPLLEAAGLRLMDAGELSHGIGYLRATRPG